MKGKWIITQDRDRVVLLTSISQIGVKLVEISSQFAGFNLLLDGILLGTFDTLDEINKEIMGILENKGEFHVISGYSPY